MQRDPIKGFLEHVDLIVVHKGEKVTVDVPVHVVGEAGPDTLVVTEHATVSLEAEATHIPESIEVSVEGAEAGTRSSPRTSQLPEGSTLPARRGAPSSSTSPHAPDAEEVEAELAEAEAEAGIEREEPEEEAAEGGRRGRGRRGRGRGE